MKIRFFLLVMIAVLTTGCASAVPQIDYYDVDTEALQRLRGLTVLDDPTIERGNYQVLGDVEGLFCDRNQMYGVGSAEAKRVAVDQLKIRAAQLGADHISTPSCEVSESMDLTNNCWNSVMCSAEALAVQPDAD